MAQRIIDDVKARGDEALLDYTAQFDRATLTDLRVTEAEIELAVAEVGEEFLAAIAEAAFSIEEFHQRQVTQSWFTADERGVFLGQKVTPLARVGIYVPGGRACYPSIRAHERDPGHRGGCRARSRWSCRPMPTAA